ncbi:M1 family metallopeptidase [Aurantibacter crassamenti]|uniref:M1 family metallopeptidase n=1 Tax=Aurantibacter crassamenti TaxID=1837375 RepID=UPI0019392F84|nr:M1 family metallopeptidase [Aurantibacter crassamenti]MBM1107262.1 M1 family metallopeptidase [Aurantibacter crassamenti]
MNRIFILLFLSLSFSVIAQHQDKVDFILATVSLEPIPEKKQITASVTYDFNVLQNVDSIFLDAKKMNFSAVLINDKKVDYVNDSSTISIFKKFKKGKHYKLKLDYTCTPKQTVYFLGWDDAIAGNEQIWTQGQGKYTSHWLPSFDAMEEKVEFDLNITAKSNFQVIANGNLVGTSNEKSQMKTWHYDMQNPMSSYLLAFVVGDYKKQELKSTSGVSIENYYYPKDSLRVEPTYRYTKEIFDFLENEIGVAYPWQNYKQIPVHDFLYAGMENTSATIFSDQYMIDSIAFVDKNYINVNAHELAHQWFGDLVTEKSGSHHWLQEGFATYYAYLSEKHVFDDDHFYWKLFKTAKELQKISEDGAGQALTDPKASSATFYEKGAWALVMLKEQIGEEAFKKGIVSYLNKYKFKNVTIPEFLKEMELASGKSLDAYQSKWLLSTEFPWIAAKTYLKEKNPSIKKYLNLKENGITLGNWKLNAVEPIAFKEALLDELSEKLSVADLIEALEHTNIKIRQKAIQLMTEIPVDARHELEKLLNDKSYLTQEAVLYKLWSTFPEQQNNYLDQTKNIEGLPNKNVRLLWLTLAILTDGYDSLKTKEYFQELSGYSNAEYSFEIRQGAFFYLKETFGYNQEALSNLVKATSHHSWRFRNFARNLLDELVKDEEYKPRLIALSEKLNSQETRYLKSKLKE